MPLIVKILCSGYDDGHDICGPQCEVRIFTDIYDFGLYLQELYWESKHAYDNPQLAQLINEAVINKPAHESAQQAEWRALVEHCNGRSTGNDDSDYFPIYSYTWIEYHQLSELTPQQLKHL